MQQTDYTSYSKVSVFDLQEKRFYESSSVSLTVGWNKSNKVKQLAAKRLAQSKLQITPKLSLGDSVGSCAQISLQLNRESVSGSGAFNCRLKSTSFQWDNYLVSLNVRQGKLRYVSAVVAPKVDQ